MRETRASNQLIAPRPSTREAGRVARRRGSGRQTDTGGRRAGETVSKHAGGDTSHVARCTWEPWPRRWNHAPLSTHHIDIADIMKQAARSLRQPNTTSHGQGKQAANARNTTSPRSTTRGTGRGAKRGKAIRKARRCGIAGKQAKRGRMIDG